MNFPDKNLSAAIGLPVSDGLFLHADWPAPANVKTLVSTRQGGVSTAPYASLNIGAHVGDNPEHVARNRAIVQAAVPVPLAYLNQTHGTNVVAAADVCEGFFGGTIGQTEGVEHFRADFKRFGADGGGEVGEDVGGIGLHGGDGVLQDAAGQPAPACVGGGGAAAVGGAEEDGQAVGGHHRAGRLAAAVDGGVGIF